MLTSDDGVIEVPARGRRKASPSLAAIGLRALDPLAQGGLCQIEIARGCRHSLAVVEHKANGPRFELVSELAPRAPLRCVGHRSGHRIPHRKDVHWIGSIPNASLWTQVGPTK